VEPDQVDIFAFAVLGNLEQIHEAGETRLAHQLRRDVVKLDRLDGFDLDFAFFHGVPRARFDVGANPDSDTAGDVSAANSWAKTLGEHHGVSLHGRKPQSRIYNYGMSHPVETFRQFVAASIWVAPCTRFPRPSTNM
jgi:hypothetical protein